MLCGKGVLYSTVKETGEVYYRDTVNNSKDVLQEGLANDSAIQAWMSLYESHGASLMYRENSTFEMRTAFVRTLLWDTDYVWFLVYGTAATPYESIVRPGNEYLRMSIGRLQEIFSSDGDSTGPTVHDTLGKFKNPFVFDRVEESLVNNRFFITSNALPGDWASKYQAG